ncbi:hypothetical protein YpF1991016_4246 [Yersinia pestis biovar Orientalis str. F1991016]|nr:hypothetical protein YpF1991016_4246 [Yersinia pestis biovar Orientalis str. F1991016]
MTKKLRWVRQTQLNLTESLNHQQRRLSPALLCLLSNYSQ